MGRIIEFTHRQLVEDAYRTNSYQMALDLGRLVTLLPHEQQLQAIYTTGQNYQKGIAFIAHKLVPTIDFYTTIIDQSSRDQFYVLKRSIPEIEAWRKRMFEDHAVSLYGSAWLNFLSGGPQQTRYRRTA